MNLVYLSTKFQIIQIIFTILLQFLNNDDSTDLGRFWGIISQLITNKII